MSQVRLQVGLVGVGSETHGAWATRQRSGPVGEREAHPRRQADPTPRWGGEGDRSRHYTAGRDAARYVVTDASCARRTPTRGCFASTPKRPEQAPGSRAVVVLPHRAAAKEDGADERPALRAQRCATPASRLPQWLPRRRQPRRRRRFAKIRSTRCPAARRRPDDAQRRGRRWWYSRNR